MSCEHPSINFREWLEQALYNEIATLASIDASKVTLKSKGGSFDYAAARDFCADNMHLFYDETDWGVYPEAEQDPEFAGKSPEAWEEENPAPSEDDYEDRERFEEDYERWTAEREKAAEKYESDLKVWESENESRREQSVEMAIDRCVEDRQELHRDEEPGEGYTYSFTHEGDAYTVDMSKDKVNRLVGYSLPMTLTSYNIEFSGPSGYSLTGSAGSSAVKIYSNMLAAIKKLMETEEVDAFTFSAAHPFMVPMYDRFFKTYLGNQFTQVHENMYMRNDRLKEALASMSPTTRSEAEKNIGKAQKERGEQVAKVQASKKAMRDLISKKHDIIGKITGYVAYESIIVPAVVKDIEASKIILVTFGALNMPVRVPVSDYDKIVSPSLIPKEKMQHFLDEMAKKEKTYEAIMKEVPSYSGSFFDPRTPAPSDPILSRYRG